MVLQRVIVDDVDDGTDDGGGVPRYPVDERLEPALGALAVGVQVSEDVPFGVAGAREAGADEADALLLADDAHLREVGHVVFQLRREVR